MRLVRAIDDEPSDGPPRLKGTRLRDPKTRASADARFEKAQRPGGNGRSSFSPQETEARAAAAKTADLRAQRLARDSEAEPAAKRAAPVRKTGARKGVGSY